MNGMDLLITLMFMIVVPIMVVFIWGHMFGLDDDE